MVGIGTYFNFVLCPLNEANKWKQSTLTGWSFAKNIMMTLISICYKGSKDISALFTLK